MAEQEEKNIFKFLEKIYYDPKDPGSYGGIEKLYRRAKQLLPSKSISSSSSSRTPKRSRITISKSVIKRFLQAQPSYTLHRPARHNFTRNRTRVSRIDEQWQADLADMQALSRVNHGYKYLFTCIDVFSKYAWVIPIKSKSAKDMVECFHKLFSTVSVAAPSAEIVEKNTNKNHEQQQQQEKGIRLPKRIQTDKGKEFLNHQVQSVFQSYAVEHFTTWSDKKAAVVERFNRTLKSRLWQYFSAHPEVGTHYLDVLPDLVLAYNNTYHRAIGMTPDQASKRVNEQRVWTRLYLEEPRRKHFDKSAASSSSSDKNLTRARARAAAAPNGATPGSNAVGAERPPRRFQGSNATSTTHTAAAAEAAVKKKAATAPPVDLENGQLVRMSRVKG